MSERPSGRLAIPAPPRAPKPERAALPWLLSAALLLPAPGAALQARQEDPNAGPLGMGWGGEVEVGYRSRDVEGSQDLYDSHANLDEGTRLLSLRFAGQPGGAATERFMDTLSVEAYGLGGDPHEYFRVFSGKRGVYRWEVRGWRQAYVFNVPSFSVGQGTGNEGQHSNNQTDSTLDASLRITPGRFTLNFAYARRDFEGPGLLTQDFSRDEFLILGLADRSSDDYRAEISFPAGRWTLSFEQTYRNYDSLAGYELGPGEMTGNNTTNNTTLNSFLRDVPLEGTTWTSRVSANTSFADRLDLTARLVHSQGDAEFTSFQRAVGIDRTATPIDEQISAAGESERPSNLAELGLTFRLTDRWELVSLTRYSAYEIEGETEESIVTNGGAPVVTVEDRLVDLSSLEQRSEVAWRPGRRWQLRAGNRHYTRDVTLEAGGVEEESDTTTDTWYGSASVRLGAKLRGFIEYQDGEQDNLFTRIEPAEFQSGRIRGQWNPLPAFNVNLSVAYRHAENPNPDNLNEVDSWAYSLSGAYAGPRWHLSAGANLVDLDSETDVFFFASGVRTAGVSLYELEANNYFADGGVLIGPRFKGALRYQQVDSKGSFPVDYSYVQPKVSVRVLDGLWVNGAWYRYKYEEEITPLQDYETDGYVWSATYTF